MRLPSSVLFAALALTTVAIDPCEKVAPDLSCKTAYTLEADPIDERGRQMWSWTAGQLRQRCAQEFYRLDDGTMSTRFLIEQGADEAETPSSCITVLQYAGDSGFRLSCIEFLAGMNLA